MRKRKRTLIRVLCLIGCAALASVLVGLIAPSPQVYTVSEVQAGVQQHPQAWIGRTVLVRGWSNSWGGRGCFLVRRNPLLDTPQSCRAAWLMLTPTFPWSHDSTDAAFPVLLPRTGPDLTHMGLPLSAAMGLHTLPVVGQTLFRWSGTRTLRVRVTMSGPSCDDMPPCGVLLP